ncbi:cell wall / vacuolar inhibitor of fructosidase 1-like [Lotus japonicus]|uniref:cell wall / vacuolar inhibitor of fructosidase 1-like n=1 Tax=Lotus japonicus TaxID=34305 RepID=UPI00258A6DD4|nr:cell wall / vacuolar inhibitor of fructosidase 1-like [Lotus japonicus]
MKFSSISTIILISSLLMIAPIQCHFQPSLIENICRTTPHYHLCVLTLKTQQIVIHDMASCARVILKVMIARAPVVLERIQTVLAAANNEPQLKTAMDSCSNFYTQITKELLPKALSCMEKGDYKGAQQGADAAGKLAASCASKCNNKTGGSAGATSPLGDSNLYVQNMCSITVSITKQLGQTQANHQN